MRVLHTADWHLGRLLHGVHLTEDQAHLLEQFCALVDDLQPDAIVISGDLFDRAVPPTDAVRLLDETLYRIVLDQGTPIILIAGNHDSPERLGVGHRFAAQHGLFLACTLETSCNPVVLHDDDGPVAFFSAPFCEPPVVRAFLEDPDVQCYDSAMRALLTSYRSNHPGHVRSVLLGHAFVSGGAVSDSERSLSIGGVETVGTNCFEGFSYVALGHLHQPQSFERGRIRYAGSLMKYSFSEVNQRKSVSLVEIDAAGDVTIEEYRLTPRRDVRRIQGYLQEILRDPDRFGPRDDYLMADLLDDGAVFDAIGRLRNVFPNFLHLERSRLLDRDDRRRGVQDIAGKDDLTLFDDFVAEMTEARMTDDQRAYFIEVVDSVRRHEREAS